MTQSTPQPGDRGQVEVEFPTGPRMVPAEWVERRVHHVANGEIIWTMVASASWEPLSIEGFYLFQLFPGAAWQASERGNNLSGEPWKGVSR